MQIDIVNVTPALATEWMKQNDHNRPISRDRVEKYARDMKADRWELNGEAVKRALTGQLLDGQHRLQAVIDSGVTVPMVVVHGLGEGVQDTLDQGRVRTMSDILGIKGTTNAAVVAAVGRRAWMWDQGNLKFGPSTAPTPTELLDYIAGRPALNRSAEVAMQVRQAFKVAKPSVIGTAHNILMDIDIDDTALFFAQLTNGAGLQSGHPVLALRNRFLNDRFTGKKNPFHQDVALIFRAWNGVRENREMARVIHTAEEPMIKPV